MQIPIVGGCACKKIRYSCSIEPAIMLNCNCRDCQYASGNGHSSIFGVPKSALVVIGEPKFYQSRSDSGSLVRRGFCANCGTPLFSDNEKYEELIAVKASSLDDPSWFKPSMDVWLASAQPWDALSTNTTKYDHNPQV